MVNEQASPVIMIDSLSGPIVMEEGPAGSVFMLLVSSIVPAEIDHECEIKARVFCCLLLRLKLSCVLTVCTCASWKHNNVPTRTSKSMLLVLLDRNHYKNDHLVPNKKII